MVLDLEQFLNTLFDVLLPYFPFTLVWSLETRRCAQRTYQVLERRLPRCTVSKKEEEQAHRIAHVCVCGMCV